MPQFGQIVSAGAIEGLAQARSEQVLKKAKQHTEANDPKLESAAKSFESILLGKWLEQAEHSFATVPGEDPNKEESGDPGADQFRSLAFQAVAEGITAKGGIGIASMIMQQMVGPENTTQVDDSKWIEPGLPPLPKSEKSNPKRPESN
jgi:Rod binding domain-containing protein